MLNRLTKYNKNNIYKIICLSLQCKNNKVLILKHYSNMKIFLYSHTFGKRITKLYDISVVYNTVDNSTDSNIFENVVNCLLSLSKYQVHINESITYEFK